MVQFIWQGKDVTSLSNSRLMLSLLGFVTFCSLQHLYLLEPTHRHWLAITWMSQGPLGERGSMAYH